MRRRRRSYCGPSRSPDSTKIVRSSPELVPGEDTVCVKTVTSVSDTVTLRKAVPKGRVGEGVEEVEGERESRSRSRSRRGWGWGCMMGRVGEVDKVVVRERDVTERLWASGREKKMRGNTWPHKHKTRKEKNYL